MGVKKYQTKTTGTLWRLDVKIRGKTITRRGFQTRREAQKAEREIRNNAEKGLTIEFENITLSDYLNRWLEHLPALRQQGDSQRLRIKQHVANIIPSLGDIKVKNLTEKHVMELRKNSLERLAPRTVKNMETQLKASLFDGLKKGWLPRNPLQFFVTLSVDQHNVKEVEAFQPEEQVKLLEYAAKYAKDHDQRWYMLVFLGLHTGLRKGELTALQWRHIDLQERILTVRQTMEYSAGDTAGRLKKPKSKSGFREIVLSETAVSELKRYFLWASEFALKFKRKVSKDDFVLFTDNLTALSKSAPQSRWNTILRQAKLRHRGMHALRHTHASNLIAAGLNPKIIQERLGHSSIEITLDVYGHIFQKYGKEETTRALEAWEATTLKGL